MSSPIIWGGGSGAVGKAISANGVNGQAIVTDGNGNLTFATVAGLQPQAELIVGGTPPSSYTANTPIVFPTVQHDTLGAYNTSTGEYTAPYTGFYLVIAYVNTNVGVGTVTQAYVDGVAQTPSLDATESAVGIIAGSTKVYATAGQKITVCSNSNWSAVGGGGGIAISYDSPSGAATGLIGSAYLDIGSSGYYTNTSSTLAPMTGTSTTPVVEFNPGTGTIQTASVTAPAITVNSLTAGYYKVTVTGTYVASLSDSLAIYDGTSFSGQMPVNGGNPSVTMVGFFHYTTTSNITFQVYAASSNAGSNRLYSASNIGPSWILRFAVEKVG